MSSEPMNSRTASRVLFAIFVAVGLFTGIRSLAKAPVAPVAWAVALGFALLQALVIWALVRRHPGHPVNPAFVWAGLLGGFAGGIAIPSNSALVAIQSEMGWPTFVAGMVSPTEEELVKALAVLLIAVGWLRIRRPIEAAVLGIAVGGGFSIMENISYINRFALESFTSDAGGALEGALVRLSACPFAHSIYTGLAAWGIGCLLARTDKSASWRVGRMLGWFAVGYAVHGAFNASPDIAGLVSEEVQAVAFLVVLVLQWVLAFWLYARTRKIGRRS